MLPDFGWSELLVIAVVLIVIVGPKDLPGMLRTFGKTTANLRKMAGDFRRQFDDALKEAELDDVRQVAKDLKSLDPRSQFSDKFKPLGEIGEDLSSELKKAASDIEKSDKPEPAKPAEKPTGKTTAKTKAPAKSAATGASAKKTAAAKPAAGKTTTSKSAGAKSGTTKPTSAKAASAKVAAAKTTAAKSASAGRGSASRTTAAKPKATAASKASAGGTKTAAKAKPSTKTAKTGGKEQT